jgi:membrane-associated protease RseP (regulator of RpoE activity)
MIPLTLVSLGLAGGLVWVQSATAEELEAFVTGPFSSGLFWPLVVDGLPYALWVLLILGCHEMGHYLACRWYGIPATLPFFIPGPPPLGSFGAVIRIRGAIPHRRALFDVAAAGPIAGFAVALPVLLVGIVGAEAVPPADASLGEGAFGPPMLLLLLRDLIPEGGARANALIGAGWVGMLVTSLNLFPVGQLDGGHAAYAVSRRLHRVLARLTLAGMLVLILGHIYWLRQFPAYLLWFGILLWMRDRHPRLVDEISPLGAGRFLVAGLLLIIFLLSFIPVPFLLP